MWVHMVLCNQSCLSVQMASRYLSFLHLPWLNLECWTLRTNSATKLFQTCHAYQGAIDLYHFIPLSVTLTFLGVTRSVESKTSWLHSLTLFSWPAWIWCEKGIVAIQVKILFQLLNEIYCIKRINCCTDCIRKVLCWHAFWHFIKLFHSNLLRWLILFNSTFWYRSRWPWTSRSKDCEKAITSVLIFLTEISADLWMDRLLILVSLMNLILI